MNAIDEVKEETDDEAEALAKEEEAEARWKKKGKGKKGANKKVEQPVKKVVKPAPAGPRPPPIVSVATVVGGLSSVKQKRLVARGCDILVATPGRLWDLCEEVNDTLVSTDRGHAAWNIDRPSTSRTIRSPAKSRGSNSSSSMRLIE